MPALIAFSYFSKKIEVMSVEMETLVVGSDREMLLRPRRRRSRRPAAAPSPAPAPIEPAADRSDARHLKQMRVITMKFAVRKRRAPSIIIVSLVDILTILLIFFVVSTTFKKDQPEVQINLAGIEDRDESAGGSWSTPS